MSVEVAVPINHYRHFPMAPFAEAVRAIAASGVVDQMQIWDQMTSWFPQALWTPARAPMANVMPDIDSFPDAMALSAYGSALAPDLGLVFSTDAVRRGPGELTQSMLTLAAMTEGRATFHIGAGEIKQCQPYGWKRSQGLKRLEDLYNIFHGLWDADGPISYEGHYTTLDRAWLGGAKQHRPQIFGLGGGPRIIDLTTSFGDGFATMVPLVWASPEELAENIARFKEQLAAKGRNPDAFQFAIWVTVLAHDDPAVIDRALDNDILRFTATVFGRLNQGDWHKEGVEPPLPADWHYAMKYLPTRMGEAECVDWARKATRYHSENMWVFGNPAEIAEQLRPYVDAGATWIGLLDFLPFVLEIDDGANWLDRSLEIARLLKAEVTASVA
ncbi:MAG: phthiodiolone/phenolphthiodiolone dimycocerosates ketoreductase [Thermoleophilaceae bacterium]|nr:phthiodiolone/phenolphthiodiolone dimycocerosates ketoreductase [Thermoleophilaceae bacterium]